MNIQKKVIAAIPLLIDALLSVYYIVKDIIINGKRNYVFANPEIIPESTGEWIRQMALILLFFLTVASILYTIWNIISEQNEFWVLFLVLAIGTATRMAMCFTNSLFESGTRTFIELYFAFIIVIAVLYKYITDKKHQILINICLIGGMGLNCILTVIPYLQN